LYERRAAGHTRGVYGFRRYLARQSRPWLAQVLHHAAASAGIADGLAERIRRHSAAPRH
jgi:hypothetical protein